MLKIYELGGFWKPAVVVCKCCCSQQAAVIVVDVVVVVVAAVVIFLLLLRPAKLTVWLEKTGEAIFLTHRLVVSASWNRPADQDELDRRDARAATCVPPTDVCRDRDQLRSCDETRPSPKHRRRRRLARPGGRIRPCSRRLRRRRLATKTPSLLRIGTSPTRRSRASNEFTISEKSCSEQLQQNIRCWAWSGAWFEPE